MNLAFSMGILKKGQSVNRFSCIVDAARFVIHPSGLLRKKKQISCSRTYETNDNPLLRQKLGRKFCFVWKKDIRVIKARLSQTTTHISTNWHCKNNAAFRPNLLQFISLKVGVHRSSEVSTAEITGSQAYTSLVKVVTALNFSPIAISKHTSTSEWLHVH